MTKYTKNQLEEIYKSDIRTMIVRLLRIYNELSLGQLGKIMRMNKTTIQYHLKLLREKEIIIVSRESHEDSRGSIPTKYFQLKYPYERHRTEFAEIRKISDNNERAKSYEIYLEGLLAGLKDVKNQINYAEEAVEKFLDQIKKLSKKKTTSKDLDLLDILINNLRTSITSFSTTESSYKKITAEIPTIYKSFELIHNSEKESKTEGYEIITLSIPLIALIKSKIEEK